MFKQFRAGFIGKCSPVHFFWGSFDLAVTRFSGRPAPQHPGGVPHLPGLGHARGLLARGQQLRLLAGRRVAPEPVFYAYAYPEPPGFSAAAVRPDGACYNPDLREFILPYDAVRLADSTG